jgi:hypothetical protein
MQQEFNPLETFTKTFTETITKEIYSDLKSFAVSKLAPLRKISLRFKKKKYLNISDLVSDISTGKIKNGSLIELDCKFSSFGPFIKNLYIGPLAGLNTKNRLGPPIIHQSNPIMGMVAKTVSNLIPVGLYPPVSDKVAQVRLYPANIEALGFFSFFPEVNNLVPSFNALINSDFLINAHRNCRLTGKIRSVSQLEFINAGFHLEDFEVLRSIGNIWYLDATDVDSDCKLLMSETSELWAALYSVGHLEFNGEIPINSLVTGYLNKLSPLVKDLQVVQNLVNNREINIFGEGFRMVQHINFPIYALHYDINIGTNYQYQKDIYDKILLAVHETINETCYSNSVKLYNPYDLDFTYSNGLTTFKLLESLSAQNIQDPLALAIRQWIKK